MIDLPIIVMSAIGDIDKKIDLFKLGADDYVIKPFSNDELLARINVHLRKNKAIVKRTNILKYKDIEISNIQFTYENGKSVLLATIKNTASTKHTSEIVKLTILGENNQVIDEVNAILPNMQAGETKQLNTTISGADSVNAKDFKIEEKK